MMTNTMISFARYEINEEQLCKAAQFIMKEDDQRQGAFNINPVSVDGEQSYRQHTIKINTKINGKVNTDRKASMETKRAVTLAILGTALTEFGENTDITQKFRTVKRDLKTSSPDTYKIDITYLHYAALHTIEVLANSLVKGALDTADAGIDTHFKNLTSLTGITRDAFAELFGMAQHAHQAGLEARGGKLSVMTHHHQVQYQADSSTATASLNLHHTDIAQPIIAQSMTLDQILTTYCQLTDAASGITLKEASKRLPDHFLCVIKEQDAKLQCINIFKDGIKIKKIEESELNMTYFIQQLPDDTYDFFKSRPDLPLFQTNEESAKNSKLTPTTNSLYSFLSKRRLIIIPAVITVGTIFGFKSNLFTGVFNGGGLIKSFLGVVPAFMRFFKR